MVTIATEMSSSSLQFGIVLNMIIYSPLFKEILPDGNTAQEHKFEFVCPERDTI